VENFSAQRSFALPGYSTDKRAAASFARPPGVLGRAVGTPTRLASCTCTISG
jgi:hypothetical protein